MQMVKCRKRTVNFLRAGKGKSRGLLSRWGFNAFYLVLTVVSSTFLRLSGCKVDEDHERIKGREVQAVAQATQCFDSSGPRAAGVRLRGKQN
jgi:hypothetical protein